MTSPLVTRYGALLAGFPFEVVTRHWLDDDDGRPPDHAATYCDLYWDCDAMGLVALVSVEAAQADDFVTYHRVDDEIGNRFFVSTSHALVNRALLHRVLSRLEAWCAEHHEVWQSAKSISVREIVEGRI